MDAAAFLPASSQATAPFLGDYSATIPYMNPIQGGGELDQSTTIASLGTFNQEPGGRFPDPSTLPPGDIGDLAYYPYLEGPF